MVLFLLMSEALGFAACYQRDARNERIKDKNLQISKINSMEDLWHAIEQDEDLLLKPSEIVDDGGEAIDLETFRADLYKMIDEVYAEP